MRHNVSDGPDWDRLARYLAGECSGDEKDRVEAWIAASPENRDVMRLLKYAWEAPEVEVHGRDVQDLWRATAERAGIGRSPARFWGSVLDVARLRRFLPYAVILLAVAAIPYFVWRYSQPVSQPETRMMIHTVLVAPGGQEHLDLSDGTRVILDAGSSFQHPDEFTGESREVFLDGEAFFEVSQDSRRPFVIHVRDASIRVLGTRFNVRAWQGSDKIEVVVSQGRVSLGLEEAAPEEAVVVSPGQICTLREGQMPSPPLPVDVERYLLWLDREADFRDVPLQEILSLLERWYDVRFVLRDLSIYREHLTVYIDNRPLDEILELIAALTDQRFERKGNLVFLHPNTLD